MMQSHPVRLLITDLDNTLYDWVSCFVPAFYDMVEAAARTLDVPCDRLLDELRAVHQKHGNTEHPFALLETPTVIEKFSGVPLSQLKEHFQPAFEIFKQRRERDLKLYPSVAETLHALCSAGTQIVAYTEAAVYNVAHRMRVLNLWAYIHRLYAPEGHATLAREFGFTDPVDRIMLLPAGHRKPDREVLQEICSGVGLNPTDALYVGDSITRDVAMAREAGIRVAWAKYGKPNPQQWERLVRVTHWTAADVEREAGLRRRYANVRPDCCLDEFKDLKEHFAFAPFSDSCKGPS